MRLSALLLIVFTFIGAVVTFLGGTIAYQTINELRDIRRGALLGEVETTAVSATVAMSLERSVVQVALAFPEPIPSSFRNLVDAQRDTADEGLETALRKIEGVDFLTTSSDYITQTRASLGRVNDIRAEIDAQLALPITERDAKRAYELPYELKKEVVNLKNATDLLRNRVSVSTKVAGALQAVQLRAWEVREFGGRARTYFAIATLNKAPINSVDLGLLTIDNARAEEAWKSLKNSIESISGISGEISREIAAAEEIYFSEYVPLISEIERISRSTEAAGSPNYPVSFDDFFAQSNAALGAMETLSLNSGAALTGYWQDREQSALMKTIASCAFAVLSLAGLIVTYLMMRVKVVGLLGATTRILTQLASGDLDIKIRKNRRELREIVELYGTVQSFREALEEAKRVEAEAKEEAARQREAKEREAERERQAIAERAALADKEKAEAQAQQEKERRAAAEIAKVVEACAAGDFSNRLSTNDKDGIFLEICDGMNRIGEAADAGLGAVRTALKHLANGDLTHRMPGGFEGVFSEIAETMNGTAASLTETLGKIAASASNVDTSATRIADSTSDLSARSEQNAARIEETANELEQLTQNVRSAATSAETARSFVEDIAAMAHDGNSVIEKTIEAMDEIQTSSNEISKVLRLIDDIAFQTNLLALNAGVEAARAGDSGRGFAVVASEVRALAQRSSEAAKEIAGLMDTSAGTVRSGVELVQNSGEALRKIVASVDDAAQKIRDIVSSTNETSTGIGEVSRATTELDKDTRQNAGVFTATKENATSLRAEATSLNDAVSAFQIEEAAGPGAIGRSAYRRAS